MVEMKAEVVEHYGQGDLKERLSRALYAAGLSSQVLSPMVLAPLDQFHVRGNRCNEGTRGSGAGRPRRDGSGRWSGLGGPSRYLAATYGCHVTGIDLNSSFVEAARYLAERAGKIVSRDELLHLVWGYESPPVTRTVDNFIFRLRQKIERDPRHPQFIHTVYGDGYRLTIPT